MTTLRLILIACLASSLAGVLPQRGLAHGSVTADGDLCQIAIGYYTAHFKILLPGNDGRKEYCEDIPLAGEALFVMEYTHGELGRAPIDFRIIRNVTGMGRFAELEDLEGIGNMEAVTVFHRPSHVEPDVYTIMHEFSEAGDYLGIVTVRQPDTGREYTAVFPFRVGFTGFGYWPLFLLLALAAQVLYWRMNGSGPRWLRRQRRARALEEEAHA